MSYEPTEEQANALDLIADRFNAGEAETRGGGHAGVGKTALLPKLPEWLGIDPERMLIIAPTNKATQNAKGKLHSEGVFCPAITAYSLLYGRPDELHCADCVASGATVCVHGRRHKCLCGKLEWTPKGVSDMFSLVVCDEASMVNTELYQDLSDIPVPVLYLGDHGQLSPVEPARENRGFSVMKPDTLHFKLETVHRQVAGSQILKVATAARKGLPFRPGVYGKHKEVKVEANTIKARSRRYTADPRRVFLAHQNRTLLKVNVAAREALGMRGVVAVGDRLLCKTNLHKEDVYNGMMGTVQEVLRMPGGHHLATVRLDADGRLWEGYVDVWASADYRTSESTKPLPKGSTLSRWQYGYCLTVHSAQGSEWPSVVVIDDYHERYRSTPEYARWAYTAVTRAKKRLTVLV